VIFIINFCLRTCTVKGKYLLLSSMCLRTYAYKGDLLPLSSHTDNNNYMLICSTWMTVTENYWKNGEIFIFFSCKIISSTQGQTDYWHKWNLQFALWMYLTFLYLHQKKKLMVSGSHIFL
jgi:hypothetical protein